MYGKKRFAVWIPWTGPGIFKFQTNEDPVIFYFRYTYLPYTCTGIVFRKRENIITPDLFFLRCIFFVDSVCRSINYTMRADEGRGDARNGCWKGTRRAHVAVVSSYAAGTGNCVLPNFFFCIVSNASSCKFVSF